MLTIVITGLVLMRARSLSEVLSSSSSSDLWKEWELRGVVFLSLALQIVLICLGSLRKYLPHAWIKVVTWLAYLLADSVAIYTIGMISKTIREIQAGKSLSNPHTELSTFWAPFLLLHLGGPDTISAYAIEDNELWLRHSLTLVNQAGLTVYVLLMAGTHHTLLFLAFLILLSGFYKYGERVWVLRAASHEHFKDSFAAESRPRRKYSGKIEAECRSKQKEGYDFMPHHVIDIDNEDAIMINVAISEFSSKKLGFGKDLEDQECKRVAGTLLSASRLVDTSQRLFADHLFSLEERDSCLSILRGKHCAENFKVVEIELGLIYDMFYSKANAVYTRWGFICRLAMLFSICVALVLFSFTDKRPYSKPDIFLTLLLLGAAIFVELYALANFLFSDQFAIWLTKEKKSAVFYFINRIRIRIRPLLERRRWSNSMGQYNLMSFKRNDSRWWSFLERLHIEEMVVKFLYRRHVDVTDEIKNLILSKVKEMEARGVQKLQAWEAQKLQAARDARKLSPRDAQELLKQQAARDAQEPQAFQMRDRGSHALSKHGLLKYELQESIEELEFDESILVWHIATELCYYLDYGWGDSNKERERNNQSRVKEKCLMGLHLSRYMIYVQYMCPSMLPARFGSIRFQDIYKEPTQYFDLSKKPPDNAEARNKWLGRMIHKIRESESEEDQVKLEVETVLIRGCQVAEELQGVPRGWRWSAIGEVWVEMVMYGANKCKARDHAQHMRGGSELITHVWLLMAHYGLTDSFQKSTRRPTATAEIIVNKWGSRRQDL